jgi:hypothetical protein
MDVSEALCALYQGRTGALTRLDVSHCEDLDFSADTSMYLPASSCQLCEVVAGRFQAYCDYSMPLALHAL